MHRILLDVLGLDSTNVRILQTLYRRPGICVNACARLVGLSSATVRKRLRFLAELGLAECFCVHTRCSAYPVSAEVARGRLIAKVEELCRGVLTICEKLCRGGGLSKEEVKLLGRVLGLSEGAVETYMVLVRAGGRASAVEIARVRGVSPKMVDAYMWDLIRLGLVRREGGCYVAVSCEEALERVRKKVEQLRREIEKAVEKLFAELALDKSF